MASGSQDIGEVGEGGGAGGGAPGGGGGGGDHRRPPLRPQQCFIALQKLSLTDTCKDYGINYRLMLKDYDLREPTTATSGGQPSTSGQQQSSSQSSAATASASGRSHKKKQSATKTKSRVVNGLVNGGGGDASGTTEDATDGYDTDWEAVGQIETSLKGGAATTSAQLTPNQRHRTAGRPTKTTSTANGKRKKGADSKCRSAPKRHKKSAQCVTGKSGPIDAFEESVATSSSSQSSSVVSGVVGAPTRLKDINGHKRCGGGVNASTLTGSGHQKGDKKLPTNRKKGSSGGGTDRKKQQQKQPQKRRRLNGQRRTQPFAEDHIIAFLGERFRANDLHYRHCLCENQCEADELSLAFHLMCNTNDEPRRRPRDITIALYGPTAVADNGLIDGTGDESAGELTGAESEHQLLSLLPDADDVYQHTMNEDFIANGVNSFVTNTALILLPSATATTGATNGVVPVPLPIATGSATGGDGLPVVDDVMNTSFSDSGGLLADLDVNATLPDLSQVLTDLLDIT